MGKAMLELTLDQVDAALVVVERLRAVPWVAQPAVCTVPNRSELDGELAQLRAYLVTARAAIENEIEDDDRAPRPPRLPLFITVAPEPDVCRGCGIDLHGVRGVGAFCCMTCCDGEQCTEEGRDCPHPPRAR